MRPIILSLIGKPLSGKDTQADAVVRAHPEAVNISTGAIIREVAKEGERHRFWSLMGPYIPMMEQGLKLPDEPTVAMLKAVMQEKLAEGKKILVVAGSPRGMTQLDGFDEIARETGAKFINILLDASDEVTADRSLNRKEGRVDDDPSVHAVRLSEYAAHVLPMVDRLRQEGRLVVIDAEQPIDTITNYIEKELDCHCDPEITLPRAARK